MGTKKKKRKKKKKEPIRRGRRDITLEEAKIETPPDPDDVEVSIKIFNWGRDYFAQSHANKGGISLLIVPKDRGMKGKKPNQQALLIYGTDRDHVLIFKQWIGAPNKQFHGVADRGGGRYRLLVGGKVMRRALNYANTK